MKSAFQRPGQLRQCGVERLKLKPGGSLSADSAAYQGARQQSGTPGVPVQSSLREDPSTSTCDIASTCYITPLHDSRSIPPTPNIHQRQAPPRYESQQCLQT